MFILVRSTSLAPFLPLCLSPYPLLSFSLFLSLSLSLTLAFSSLQTNKRILVKKNSLSEVIQYIIFYFCWLGVKPAVSSKAWFCCTGFCTSCRRCSECTATTSPTACCVRRSTLCVGSSTFCTANRSSCRCLAVWHHCWIWLLPLRDPWTPARYRAVVLWVCGCAQVWRWLYLPLQW